MEKHGITSLEALSEVDKNWKMKLLISGMDEKLVDSVIYAASKYKSMRKNSGNSSKSDGVIGANKNSAPAKEYINQFMGKDFSPESYEMVQNTPGLLNEVKKQIKDLIKEGFKEEEPDFDFEDSCGSYDEKLISALVESFHQSVGQEDYKGNKILVYGPTQVGKSSLKRFVQVYSKILRNIPLVVLTKGVSECNDLSTKLSKCCVGK